MHRILLGLVMTNYMLVTVTIYLGLLSQPPSDVNSPGNDAFMSSPYVTITSIAHCQKS